MKPAYKPVLCVVSSHPIKGASGLAGASSIMAAQSHRIRLILP